MSINCGDAGEFAAFRELPDFGIAIGAHGGAGHRLLNSVGPNSMVTEVRQMFDHWRQTYNRRRPHSSLGGLTPTEYSRRCTALAPAEKGPALQQHNAVLSQPLHSQRCINFSGQTTLRLDQLLCQPVLHATMLHAMGLDHKKLTYRYAGRDFRLTDVHGNVIHDILS